MNLLLKEISVPSPETLAGLIEQTHPAVWLDSALSDHPRSRYSLLVLSPLAVLTLNDFGRGSLQQGGRVRSIENPVEFLERWMGRFKSQDILPPGFSGGIVGYLAYESYLQRISHLGGTREQDLPDAVFLLVDSGIVIDSAFGKAWVFSRGIEEDLTGENKKLARSRAEEIILKLNEDRPTPNKIFQVESVLSHPQKEIYLKNIERIKDAIFRGDCYQVNYSQRFEIHGQWEPGDLYLRLRSHSPAGQMAFINLGEKQILSASPETVWESEGRAVRSFPIKGTRSRHQIPRRDWEITEELFQSEKDNAELLMIVDLVRNDLGKICEYGSIRVPVLKRVESFAQVHHLVACVAGRLREEISPLRGLLEISPGGSITGAPKLKAMELIQKLEEEPRGIYTGSVGYWGFNGRSNFNICIRTAVVKNNSLVYRAGGGIVADSDPAKEYQETLDKTLGLFQALGLEAQGWTMRNFEGDREDARIGLL